MVSDSFPFAHVIYSHIPPPPIESRTIFPSNVRLTLMYNEKKRVGKDNRHSKRSNARGESRLHDCFKGYVSFVHRHFSPKRGSWSRTFGFARRIKIRFPKARAQRKRGAYPSHHPFLGVHILCAGELNEAKIALERIKGNDGNHSLISTMLLSIPCLYKCRLPRKLDTARTKVESEYNFLTTLPVDFNIFNTCASIIKSII